METKKKFPGAGQFDSVNSTYKHRIHLSNGKELVGYSKGLYVSEPADKTVLLERVIVRLVNNGYLNIGRVDRIEFFYNKFLQGNDELILTLYPAMYGLGKNERIITDFRLAGFLRKLYEQLGQGKEALKANIHKPVISTEEDLLDTRKKRFPTEEKLHQYIITLLNRGMESAAVANFYRVYKEKHLSYGQN